MCIFFLMYIFYILHTASTDDVLLRNLAKVWMSKDELDNNCFSILTKMIKDGWDLTKARMLIRIQSFDEYDK